MRRLTRSNEAVAAARHDASAGRVTLAVLVSLVRELPPAKLDQLRVIPLWA